MAPIPSTPLRGAHVVITGAAGDIGAAIAARFAARGALITLASRNAGNLMRVRDSLPPFDPAAWQHGTVPVGESAAPPPLQHRVQRVDVSNANSVGAFFVNKELWDPVGNHIDVLVNAAGITHSCSFHRMPIDAIQNVVNTNLLGAMYMSRYASKLMVKQRAGCIINISSVMGIKGGRGDVVYASTKAGMLGLTRSMANELGPFRVRVNTVLPGYIQGSMVNAVSSGVKNDLMKAVPLRRLGEPDEIASAAEFLVDNNYANNCHLNIDGGLSAV